MTRFRLIGSSCLLAASSFALAQPAPPAAPVHPVTPMPAAAPAPPVLRDLEPEQVYIDRDAVREEVERARELVRIVDLDAVREQAREAREEARAQEEVIRSFNLDQVRTEAARAREEARTALRTSGITLFSDAQAVPVPPTSPSAPRPATAPAAYRIFGGSVDSLYERGLRSLDRHAYDEALGDFTQVAGRAGSHADGALYWKAYTLDRLGRRDDALAAIADLRKNYASSRWLDDAKALEIQVKQNSGQKVSPESESDEELKLLALNGLMQSDPDRAYPYLEKLLKGAQSPHLKRNALFVLAENNSPKFRQLLEQVARGGANPDLQVTAIQYLGGRNKHNTPLLLEIYNSTQDTTVKRAVLNALGDDKAAILQIAKSEKNPDLRISAIQRMGRPEDQAEVWQLYQSEQDPNVKRQILSHMSGNTDKLLEVARNDKDPAMRRTAVSMLGSTRNQQGTSDALVQLYGSGQDAQMKRSIINALSGQRNVQGLIAIARKEQDPELKRDVVRRLVDMHSPEANQFMEEILKK